MKGLTLLIRLFHLGETINVSMTTQELMAKPMPPYGTFSDYLNTLPAKWHSIALEAAFECLNRGWAFIDAHIEMIAREISKKK